MKVYITKGVDFFDANFNNAGVADFFCTSAAMFSVVDTIYGKNVFLGTGAKTYKTIRPPSKLPDSYTITLSEYVHLRTIDYEGFMSYIEKLGVEVEYYETIMHVEER